LPFLPPDTGEIVTATEEVRPLAEEQEESQDNLPAWQREMVREVRAMLASSRCLQLPDRFRIHEWSIMNEFAEAQHSKQGAAGTAGGYFMGQTRFGCFRVRSGAWA
jgi:hypothetical protein